MQCYKVILLIKILTSSIYAYGTNDTVGVYCGIGYSDTLLTRNEICEICMDIISNRDNAVVLNLNNEVDEYIDKSYYSEGEAVKIVAGKNRCTSILITYFDSNKMIVEIRNNKMKLEGKFMINMEDLGNKEDITMSLIRIIDFVKI